MTKLVRCPHCGRRFADENGRWSHLTSKHRGKKIAYMRPEQEPSMADLAIEARRLRDGGQPVPGYLQGFNP